MEKKLASLRFCRAFERLDFGDPVVLTQPGVEGAVAYPPTLNGAALLFAVAKTPEEMEIAGTVWKAALKKAGWVRIRRTEPGGSEWRLA